jgi:hypothetical protein
MTASKLPLSKKQIRDLFAERAMGDGDPAVYTPEELKVLVKYGLQYLRGVVKGRHTTAAHKDAEAFMRKFEIIRIFRELPDHLRKRPSGEATMDKVRNRLKEIGIAFSKRTLMRDYRELGGTKRLRDVKPFQPEEDKSSPLQEYHRRKPNKATS